MKRQKSLKPAVKAGDRIKLRIDYRTVIVVRSQEALAMWMSKFPAAQIID
ncbi:MAG TPA: hypothetical protein VFU15_02210 [Bacteroidia bacterium]|nr:hypothetical protein [Bacteroidia bacterium]